MTGFRFFKLAFTDNTGLFEPLRFRKRNDTYLKEEPAAFPNRLNMYFGDRVMHRLYNSILPGKKDSKA